MKTCSSWIIVLVALLRANIAVARAVSPETLPASVFADTEVSTNVSLTAAVTCAAGDNVRFFDVELLLAATPTNNVEIVFGHDADGDGELSRLERDFVLGWDSGAWFWRDRRNNVENRLASGGAASGRRTLRWRVTLDADHRPRRVSASEGRATLCERAATSEMFSSLWDTARIVARGRATPEERISVRMNRNAMRIILR